MIKVGMMDNKWVVGRMGDDNKIIGYTVNEYTTEQEAYRDAYNRCDDEAKLDLFKEAIIDGYLDESRISANASESSWDATSLINGREANEFYLTHSPAIWLMLESAANEYGSDGVLGYVNDVTPSFQSINDAWNFHQAMAWAGYNAACLEISYEYCERCNERHNIDDCDKCESCQQSLCVCQYCPNCEETIRFNGYTCSNCGA